MASLSLKMGKLIFMWPWVPYDICHNRDIGSPPTYQIAMILTRLSTWNFYHFHIPNLGKVRGVEVALASGSFAIIHNTCLMMACEVGATGQSQCLPHIPPRGFVSTIESKWLGCCWMGTWMPWSSC